MDCTRIPISSCCISKKEKDVTWKIDVFNSAMLVIHHAHVIIMHGMTIFIENIYLYTGSWFCYTSKVLAIYGNAHTGGHSFMVAIAKYVLIVHYAKVRSFGQEKVKTIIFWLNIIEMKPRSQIWQR